MECEVEGCATLEILPIRIRPWHKHTYIHSYIHSYMRYMAILRYLCPRRSGWSPHRGGRGCKPSATESTACDLHIIVFACMYVCMYVCMLGEVGINVGTCVSFQDQLDDIQVCMYCMHWMCVYVCVCMYGTVLCVDVCTGVHQHANGAGQILLGTNMQRGRTCTRMYVCIME